MANSNAKPTAAPIEKANEDTSVPAPATPDTEDTTAVDTETTTPTTDVAQSAATTEENQTAAETDAPEVKESMKRNELNAIATEAGLANVSKYKDKAAVVSAIERVRAGEDVAAIDAELAPVEDDKEADANVEVEVAAPFYDLQTDRNRSAGETYKTTEARANELRGRSLVK